MNGGEVFVEVYKTVPSLGDCNHSSRGDPWGVNPIVPDDTLPQEAKSVIRPVVVDYGATLKGFTMNRCSGPITRTYLSRSIRSNVIQVDISGVQSLEQQCTGIVFVKSNFAIKRLSCVSRYERNRENTGISQIAARSPVQDSVQ